MQEDFKSIRRLRYPLPEVINPTESVCIEVHVPNDIAYISAFWGQMFALTRWYAWLGDAAHTAKDVAAVWRGVYEQAQESECQNVLVRTSPVNDCLLQVSYDGGALWETVYNAYGCALKAAADEFGSHSDQPAGHSQPGEQPGGANPQPAQCFDLDVTVQGNSMFLIPLAVGSGWILEFTQVKGVWNDGNIGHDWVCPNGHAFFLGTCSPLEEGHDAADPIPTKPHMLLILRLADGTYTDIPLDGTAYTVPSGQPNGNYFLMPNDSLLSDNQGSVSLHVLACSPGWCAEIDFTQSDGGFTPILDGINAQPLATYAAGVGWQSVHQTSQNDVIAAITRTFGANFTPTSIEWFYTASPQGSGVNGYVFEGQSVNPPMDSGPSYLFNLNGTAGDLVQAYIYANLNGTAGAVTITKVRFRGAAGSPPVATACA